MEKKHLIMAVAGILVLALVVGLLLPALTPAQTPPAVDPTEDTASSVPVDTQPTTLPSETTQPVEQTTTPTEEPTTSPTTEPTVPPTQPGHTHTYEKKQTVEPTLDAPGYTLYTCSGCGNSYRGDTVAALTLQQVINAQSLNPTKTGIAPLDTLVSDCLSQIIPANATNYQKLEAIYGYIQTGFSQGSAEVDLTKAVELAGDKVFYNSGDLLFSYEAYQMLTQKVGVGDHYAALFYVLTRGAGFESYVVSGSVNGKSHVWNNVRIDGKLYAFDAYRADDPRFAVADGALTGYVYKNRERDMAAQSGFRTAESFAVKLTYTDDSGTTEKEFTWSAADMRKGTANFMKNSPAVIRAKGTVTYTLEVISTGGSYLLTDALGEETAAASISGILEPGAGFYTLTAEEEKSLMHFDLRIDN
ncbi:MAG: hypothetical protein IJB17_05280 [Oscillospiraceae bacterium]|nr:hypothetical protein [Oscillospiraceae bacterium]